MSRNGVSEVVWYLPEKAAQGYEVDFSLWVSKTAYETGIYEDVFLASIKWLMHDWPFKRVWVRNSLIPKRVGELLEKQTAMFGWEE